MDNTPPSAPRQLMARLLVPNYPDTLDAALILAASVSWVAREMCKQARKDGLALVLPSLRWLPDRDCDTADAYLLRCTCLTTSLNFVESS